MKYTRIAPFLFLVLLSHCFSLPVHAASAFKFTSHTSGNIEVKPGDTITITWEGDLPTTLYNNAPQLSLDDVNAAEHYISFDRDYHAYKFFGTSVENISIQGQSATFTVPKDILPSVYRIGFLNLKLWTTGTIEIKETRTLKVTSQATNIKVKRGERISVTYEKNSYPVNYNDRRETIGLSRVDDKSNRGKYAMADFGSGDNRVFVVPRYIPNGLYRVYVRSQGVVGESVGIVEITPESVLTVTSQTASEIEMRPGDPLHVTWTTDESVKKIPKVWMVLQGHSVNDGYLAQNYLFGGMNIIYVMTWTHRPGERGGLYDIPYYPMINKNKSVKEGISPLLGEIKTFIPDNIPKGTYKVFFTTVDPEVSYGEFFFLGESVGSIKILDPLIVTVQENIKITSHTTGNTKLKPGDTLDVTWDTGGFEKSLYPKVTIGLQAVGDTSLTFGVKRTPALSGLTWGPNKYNISRTSKAFNISDNKNNTGKQSIKIPAQKGGTIKPGFYNIILEFSKSGYVGFVAKSIGTVEIMKDPADTSTETPPVDVKPKPEVDKVTYTNTPVDSNVTQRKGGDYLGSELKTYVNNPSIKITYPFNIGLQRVGNTSLEKFYTENPGQTALTTTGSLVDGVYLIKYGLQEGLTERSMGVGNVWEVSTYTLRLPMSAGTAQGIPPGKYRAFLEFKDANGLVKKVSPLLFGSPSILEILTKSQEYTENTLVTRETPLAKKPITLKGVKAPTSATVGAKTYWTLSATVNPEATPVFSVTDWGDGTAGNTAPISTSGTYVSGLSAVFEHVFEKPGTYTVKFSGTDTKTNTTSTGVKKITVKATKATKPNTTGGGTSSGGGNTTADENASENAGTPITPTAEIAANIVVTSQNTDTTVKLGAPLSVTWTSNPAAKKEKMMIYLVPEATGGTTYTLRSSVANDGKTTGLTIPKTVKPGVYRVKVMVKGKEDSAATSVGTVTIPEKTSSLIPFTANILSPFQNLFWGR